MTLVERYVFKIAANAFLVTLGVLTAVIWLTQALHDFDLMTTKGQSILVFLRVTGLWIPSLAMVIAPIALFIAILFALNKLNGDSELVVMAAAGLAPWTLARAFAVLTLAAAGFVAFLSLWAMPWSFRALREARVQVQSDFLSRVVREGQFINLEDALVFHYRERGPGGVLLGVFMLDRRDPDKTSAYLAERGFTAKVDDQNYLVLETGTIQRQNKGAGSPALIAFDSYALDLSHFGPQGDGSPLRARERTTSDLLHADRADAYVNANEGRFRAELHDRFTGVLYALAMGMIGFAALGTPRTTRQTRGVAVGGAVVCVCLLRVAGFGVSAMTAREPLAIYPAYFLPIFGFLAGAFYAFGPDLAARARRRRPPAPVGHGSWA